jgi:hypothetical protein
MPRWHELHRQIALAAISCAAQGFARQARILLELARRRSLASLQDKEKRVMRIRTACAVVFALNFLAGPASADAFSDLASLPSFYSDTGMKTMKPMAGFKKAWLAAPRKDRDTMMKMCNDAAMSKPHAAFCANVLALGGAN